MNILLEFTLKMYVIVLLYIMLSMNPSLWNILCFLNDNETKWKLLDWVKSWLIETEITLNCVSASFSCYFERPSNPIFDWTRIIIADTPAIITIVWNTSVQTTAFKPPCKIKFFIIHWEFIRVVWRHKSESLSASHKCAYTSLSQGNEIKTMELSAWSFSAMVIFW